MSEVDPSPSVDLDSKFPVAASHPYKRGISYGSLHGMVAGLMGGAATGTAAFPILGTLFGAAIGALLGAIGGALLAPLVVFAALKQRNVARALLIGQIIGAVAVVILGVVSVFGAIAFWLGPFAGAYGATEVIKSLVDSNTAKEIDRKEHGFRFSRRYLFIICMIAMIGYVTYLIAVI